VPSALDNWSPSNKAACFRRFAQELKEQTKQVFLKDKHHSEMFFFVTDDGQAGVMLAPPKIDRDEMVAKLKQKIRQNNVYGVVHIVETWTYFRSGAKDHTMTQIMAGEIKVSELRPQDRDEALVVTMESREGAHFMWITPILRDADKVTLGETMNFDDRIDGRFAGFFSDE
jgi:hypothetical protein